jgi:hypothetical protein
MHGACVKVGLIAWLTIMPCGEPTRPPYRNQAYFFIWDYDPSYTDPRGRRIYLSANHALNEAAPVRGLMTRVPVRHVIELEGHHESFW